MDELICRIRLTRYGEDDNNGLITTDGSRLPRSGDLFPYMGTVYRISATMEKWDNDLEHGTSKFLDLYGAPYDAIQFGKDCVSERWLERWDAEMERQRRNERLNKFLRALAYACWFALGMAL